MRIQVEDRIDAAAGIPHRCHAAHERCATFPASDDGHRDSMDASRAGDAVDETADDHARRRQRGQAHEPVG